MENNAAAVVVVEAVDFVAKAGACYSSVIFLVKKNSSFHITHKIMGFHLNIEKCLLLLLLLEKLNMTCLPLRAVKAAGCFSDLHLSHLQLQLVLRISLSIVQ